MKISLVVPPFAQINTTYPSVLQLSGYLNKNGYETLSVDLSLNVILSLFCKDGLKRLFDIVDAKNVDDYSTIRMLSLKNEYISKVDLVIKFLQGKDNNLAKLILTEGFLPQGDSFTNELNEEKTFGELGDVDKAKYYGSLFIDDLVLFIQKNITPAFGLSRYAERISSSTSKFSILEKELSKTPNLIDEFIIEETQKFVEVNNPDVIGYSIAFPGNLLGALISAKYIKENWPEKKILFGGGYVNTELRELKDKSIFKYCDYITLDDGEHPILNIIKNLEGREEKVWVRTFLIKDGGLKYIDDANNKHLKHDQLTSPNIKGIEPADYISMTEMANPMHRLWSDGYWNKLTLAHGCYWHRCTFCDTTLDYIKRYSPAKAKTIVDWMEDMIEQTRVRSFHFTDEAAPPALLREVAIEILNRKLSLVWWGNIRFEKSFTKDLCRLLKASGCIAVSGGVEVADERLLKLINKGVSIEQVSKVFKNFQDAGIMVHAYLMYGFPTQTEQETINSLEIVRQFFENGLVQSGFWHQFALTVHSPIAFDTSKYAIEITNSLNNDFANNDLKHKDLTGCDHKKYSQGLKKAIYNYMHGIGFDWPVEEWFDFKVSKTKIDKDLVTKYLSRYESQIPSAKNISVWLAETPILTELNNSTTNFHILNNELDGSWEIDSQIAKWLDENIQQTIVYNKRSFKEWQSTFPGTEIEFQNFLNSELWHDLRENVLLFV